MSSTFSDNARQDVSKQVNSKELDKNVELNSIKFWAIMIGLYLAIFLVALDRMIIAVAIPAITDEFDSIEDIGWYGTAYLLTGSCFVPVFGRIYQMYSLKWTFLTTIIVFEIGSAICGAAPNSIALIFGRVIAGLGSAGIFSGGMMIMIPLVPLHKRPTYTAIFGMIFGISSVLGPIIGGSFTDKLTWRWCFYINLPIGACTILAIILLLELETPKRENLTVLTRILRLDPIGVLFFFPSMVCLVLALQWGGTSYAWSEPKIIGLLVTFGVLFIVFIIVEVMTPDTAMAPTRVVLNRSMAGSMVFTFLISASLMPILYFIAIWFQAVKGDTAMRAGISSIPLVIGMVIFGIISAKITERIGYYVPSMLLSSVLCSTAAGLLSTLTPFSDHGYWIGYQALFGFGLGCGFQQSNLAAQTVLPKADMSIGMALMFFMQQLGGAVALAISQNIFSTKLVKRLSGVADLDARKIVNTGATEIRTVVPANELDTVVSAYNYAVTRVFLMAAILSALLVLAALSVEWKSIKANKDSKATEIDEEKIEKSEENPNE
ncbi:putative aflatoxin efflux pump [Amniculicola lignicola CBS 123094]|uniref:Putative aflatoxin efflux pump n=1 Tax=Amniculicola lignicola CBS 123094 TaxID=1392246 RepID=A0A6A5WTN2_9PLEO|nr:putative aflatoxin efflux pump [Amniculicola lignicola CBS 123094]